MALPTDFGVLLGRAAAGVGFSCHDYLTGSVDNIVRRGQPPFLSTVPLTEK